MSKQLVSLVFLIFLSECSLFPEGKIILTDNSNQTPAPTLFSPSHTSEYTFTPDPKKLQQSNNVTALFFGDMMFDRYIRETLDEHGWEYILDAQMKRLMNSTDLTIVNFESAMSTFTPYPAHDWMLSFTSDPKWATKMAEYGIDIASLANNHSSNFGEEGLTQSRKFLGDAGIDTFGEPNNGDSLSVIKEVNGIRIGFIGFHELFNGNPSPAISEIETLKPDTDFIVVYSHWGPEYKTFIPPASQQKAHKFIDAGADIVIGHHPHVVQPMEVYKDKYIFYSLGNFVFDQADYPSVRKRLGLGITFECESKENEKCAKKSISYILAPLISNKEHQVRLMEEDERDEFIEWFEKISK